MTGGRQPKRRLLLLLLLLLLLVVVVVGIARIPHHPCMRRGNDDRCGAQLVRVVLVPVLTCDVCTCTHTQFSTANTLSTDQLYDDTTPQYAWRSGDTANTYTNFSPTTHRGLAFLSKQDIRGACIQACS